MKLLCICTFTHNLQPFRPSHFPQSCALRRAASFKTHTHLCEWICVSAAGYLPPEKVVQILLNPPLTKKKEKQKKSVCCTYLKKKVPTTPTEWTLAIGCIPISCLIIIRREKGECVRIPACACTHVQQGRCSQWARGVETVSARQRPTNKRWTVRGRDTVRAEAACSSSTLTSTACLFVAY